MAYTAPAGPFGTTNSERPPQQADYGFGNVNQVNPQTGLQPIVEVQANQAAPVNPPLYGAPPETRNAFMPANYTAPYYNAAGVAGNIGTMLGQVAPGAASYMQGLFSPTINAFENAYLGAGLGNSMVAQEQGFNRQEAQFEGSPYHSGLQQAQGDVMNQTSRDLLSTAGQMGMQRQQLANQMAQFPFEGAMQAAQVAPNMAERMFNLGNTAFQSPLQFGTNIWSGIPVPGPVVSTGSSGGGGGKSII